MEVIRLQYPNEFKVNQDEQIAMALGFFDGLHIGHQEVINTMIEIADKKGLKKAVLTFARQINAN